MPALSKRQIQSAVPLPDPPHPAGLQAAERFIHVLPWHVAVIDPDGVIRAVNDAWRQFGHANGLRCPNGGVGRNYLRVCHAAQGPHSEGAAEAAAGIQSVLSKQAPLFTMEYRLPTPAGDRWFVFRAVAMNGHASNHVLVGHEDVTDRKRTELVLAESEARYRALFEGAGEGIILADAHTRSFHYANPAAARMLGYPPEELAHLHLEDIHPPPAIPRAVAHFDAMAQGQDLTLTDMPLLRKDGTTFIADIVASRLTVDGRPHVAGFFTDVSRRKAAEQKLHEYRAHLEATIAQQTHALRAQADELQRANDALQRKNAALTEVLASIEERQRDVGRRILTNAEQTVLPLLQSLLPGLSGRHRETMERALGELRELTAPFAHALQRRFADLTPTELRVCTHLRQGLSSKEIARVEGISTGTVHRHRESIRRKLGLANTATNLAAHLQQYDPDPLA